MNKSLVAYFSASGVTVSLVKRLASLISADLFEIKPEVPYTKVDLIVKPFVTVGAVHTLIASVNYCMRGL